MILERDEFIDVYRRYECGEDVVPELLGLLQPLIEATASKFSNDADYRHDLIQDCMERAIKTLPKFNPKYNPYNYFTSVFRNMCITKMKRYGNGNTVPHEEYMNDVGTLPNSLEHGLEKTDETVRIITTLLERNIERFPSEDVETVRTLTVKVYTQLMSGNYPKQVISTLSKDYPRKLVTSVCHATVIWLRFENLHTAHFQYDIPAEHSVLRDLYDILDEETYELLCTVCAGMRVTFPSNGS